MMYSNKLAVALKSAGRVLREFKDEVYVPFGSEFSVFIKNMNSVRALVKVTIDGQDVGDGVRFVVNANDTIDLERFIKNGNFNQGNRFKFIERTGSIEQHRGIGIEDGIVRVEFNFEKPQPTYVPYVPPYWGSPYRPYKKLGGYDWGDTWTTCSSGDNFGSISGSSGHAFYNANNGSVGGSVAGDLGQSVSLTSAVGASAEAKSVANDAGITVPGSISDQRFYNAGYFPTETETHVIVLKMLGQTKDNVQVRQAVTVKQKPTCTSCGRTNKANAKFCTECGTSLQIV